MSSAQPLLAVHGLGVSYGGVHALEDVSFDITAGVTGLIGPNGAGKTTLVDALSGYVQSNKGRLTFEGKDVTTSKPHVRARAGLRRTFQSIELFDDLTVRENLLVSAEQVDLRGLLRDLVLPQRQADQSAIDLALRVCGLLDWADHYPRNLSHGRRKLVGVARALASRPRLVLLDEPAAGLDSEESAELGRSLRRLPAHGISVLLIDHDMPLVLGICDEVLVLDFGRLVAHGAPQQIREDPCVIAAYLGTT